jgi:DNA polymerase III delta subunit
MDLTPHTILWTLAGALLALAIVAAIAERRRTSRRNLDRPGLIPWNVIQILAFMAALAAAALAIKL